MNSVVSLLKRFPPLRHLVKDREQRDGDAAAGAEPAPEAFVFLDGVNLLQRACVDDRAVRASGQRWFET